MAKTRMQNSIEIVSKKEILEAARGQLKKEFVGLDNIINELINIVSSWYIFPYVQEKPLIINMWGLTGTGKTSLVNRLVELLNYNDRFFKFNMSESDSHTLEVGRVLENAYDEIGNIPVILSFDEFQNARTISEDGFEKEKPFMREVWDLLDSGKLWITREEKMTNFLSEYIKFCRYMFKQGVRVENGIIVENKELFIENLKMSQERGTFFYGTSLYMLQMEPESSLTKEMYLVDMEIANYLYKMSKDIFSSIYELNDKLSTLDGDQTIELLEKLLNHATAMKIIDSTKSLIFIMGNIDDAYSMVDNYTVDLSADEFYEESKKVNITHIKEALKKRFRNEQIARLGNIHLIYPAFNEAGFRAIIEKELTKINEKMDNEFSIRVAFNKALKDLIYSEGVIPAQGVRPLLTTIQNIVSSRLSKLMSELLINELTPDLVVFKYNNALITIEYYSAGKLIHSFRDKQILNMENLRRSNRDDKQAVIAVHESGHAILMALLLKILPETVISVSTDIGIEGMVYTKPQWEYISKREIINRIAVSLGGFVAEELVFGDENVTTGSESDIRLATGLITRMLKYSGMGEVLARFSVKDINTNTSVFDLDDTNNAKALEWLNKGRELAEKTLKENFKLLLKMSDWLSDERMINKEQIKNLLLSYADDFKEHELINNGKPSFYRDHLKNLVKEYDKPTLNVTFCKPFSLNKNGGLKPC
jgi:cell division protease FtsH